jgi:hypothetical protein
MLWEMFDMNDKPKNDKLKNDAPRINNILFLLLWIAGHAASWMLAIGVNQLLISQRIYIRDQLLLVMLMALGTGIPTALVQLLLIERGLKKTMRGWLPVSIIGWTLSGLVFHWMWTHMSDIYTLAPDQFINFLPRLFFLPLFVPVALLQWMWLQRKVKSAGLWVLSAFAASLLFTMVRGPHYFGGWYTTRGPMEYVLIAAAALLYSGATGGTMLYLWNQQREKSKNEAAQAQQLELNDAERLARLSDGADGRQAGSSELPQPVKSAQAVL